MMTNQHLKVALDYRKAGLSSIPTSPETKKPTVSWKVYQDRLPTEAELQETFKNAKGLGIITGKVSGNMELIDFDNKAELFPVWAEIVDREAPGLLKRPLIQKSQSGGRHVGYRCSGMEIPGNTKLAQRGVDITESVLGLLKDLEVDPGDEAAVKKALPAMKVEVGGKTYAPHLINGKFLVIITLIETRGEGGYFLADPSPGYKLIQGSFADVLEITAGERRILIEAASSLNEWVDLQKVEGFGYRIPKEARRPGDDFNERGNVAEILVKHKWEAVGAKSIYQHYRRPGKDRGQSASLIDDRMFRVFSSNAYPFESETTYSPFAVFAYLECDGDFIKAAGELARLGYGSRKKKPKEETPEAKPTQAELLLKLAAEAELFHDRNRKGYASFPVDSHLETWPIKSVAFRDWLRGLFYKAHGKPPGGQALQDALDLLAAQARFDGQEHEVNVRVAHSSGKIYIDLANDDWQAVEIGPQGWRVVDNPPVKFRRPRGLAPMPEPKPGGNLADLKSFVNCRQEDWPLVVAWLIGAYSPGPYPIMVFQGEQGTAKSTMAKVLKCVVDPGHTPQRAAPRDIRDLMISAHNTWCLSFDNLSTLPPWLSDAFCRLSTGGGLSTRELYSDSDETILDAMRPQILNGIDSLVSRGDLADRTILLQLPQIKERLSEKKLWRAFEAAQPGILGAVFNALSAALENVHKVKLAELPRMADFAIWVAAAEPALPWKPGTFAAAYTRNREAVVEHSLEGDVVAVAVRLLMADRELWEGAPSDLLEALEALVPESTKRSKAWPKAANSLSNRLRRAATFLRAVGIEIESGYVQRARHLAIRKGMRKTVATVATVASEENQGVTCNDPCNDLFHGSLQPKPSNHGACNDSNDSNDKKPSFSKTDGDEHSLGEFDL